MMSYAKVPDLVDIVISGGIHYLDPDSSILVMVTDGKMQDKQTYLLYHASLKLGINFAFHPKAIMETDTYEKSQFKLFIDRFVKGNISPVIIHARIIPGIVITDETIYIGMNKDGFFPGTIYGRLELLARPWLYPRNDAVTESVVTRNVASHVSLQDGLIACIACSEAGLKNFMALIRDLQRF